MILLVLSLLLDVFTATESARYGKFSESYVSSISSFLTRENDVFLGARNKLVKIHFTKRNYVAQFEVLSCPPNDSGCTDYNQHLLWVNPQLLGIRTKAAHQRMILVCGSNDGAPRCILRDPGMLTVASDSISALTTVATASPDLKSLAAVEDQSGVFYASYLTNDTSHPLIGRFNGVQGTITTKLDETWLNNAQFVKLLQIDEHMYIFFKELAFNYPSPILTSRIARVCLQDKGGNRYLLNNNFRTFTKATLVCASPAPLGTGYQDYQYNFIDGAAIVNPQDNDDNGPRTLYAIFSNVPYGPCTSSAICSYSLDSIGETFQSSNFAKVFRSTTTYHTIDSVQDNCEEPRSLHDAHKYNFLRDPLRQPETGPIHTTQCRKYTAIAADRSNNMDVLFLAYTDQEEGQIFTKMAIYKGKAHIADQFKIRRHDNPVEKIVKNPIDNYVLASGSNFLLRIPVAQCRRFTSCNSCVAARDPYCGYCPHVRACMSTVNVCPGSGFITNYEEQYTPDGLCYNHQEKNKNSTRKVVKKIKRRKRRKRRK